MLTPFDTTGIVHMPHDHADKPPIEWTWPLLTVFEQGYLARVFAAVYENCHWATGDYGASDDYAAGPSFSDLAPETLRSVLEDCHEFQARYGEWPHAEHGSGFWAGRQARQHAPHFPPLEPHLGDDGLIYLREVSVGRVKWIPDSPFTGKDNCAWHLFDRPSMKPAEFYGRTG